MDRETFIKSFVEDAKKRGKTKEETYQKLQVALADFDAKQPKETKEAPSVSGFAQNVVENTGDIIKSPITMIETAKKLQETYGSPNELLLKDPAQYAKLMTSPATGLVKNYADYLPIQEIAQGKDGKQYAERLATKVYEKPVNVLLDILGAKQFAGLVKPNAANLAAGEALKAQRGLPDAQVFAQKVAPAVVPEAVATQTVKPSLNKTVAKQTYASMFNVGKYKATRNLNPVQTSEKLIQYDVVPKSLDDLSTKANIVTGRDGVVNKAVVEALGQTGDVSLDITPIAKSMRAELLKGGIKGMTPAKADAEIVNQLRNLAPTSKPGTFNALDSFEAEKTMQGIASGYWNKYALSGDVADKAWAKAFTSAADDLMMQLDDQVQAVNPKVMESLKTSERMAQLEQVSPVVARDFMNATSLKQWRQLQKTFVDAQRMVKETQMQMTRPLTQAGNSLQSGLPAGILGGVFGGPIGAIGGYLAGPTVHSLLSNVGQAARVPFAGNVAKALYNMKAPNMSGAQNLPLILQMLQQNQQK